MVPYLETNTRKYIVPTKINFLKLLEQCIAEMISNIFTWQKNTSKYYLKDNCI